MKHVTLPLALATCLTLPGAVSAQSGETLDLTETQMEELVRRSYQYVAMFNVNNKIALDPDNPMSSGGYNRVFASTDLADHTLQAIARPNNDTLFVAAMIDVTDEPIVLEMPAFDSTYVSLMVTGYDHYVNIPMSTTKGDFDEPVNILFYSERTPGYSGEPVEGVDIVMELTGDFVGAVFRVMPHAAEPERLERNLAAMRRVDVEPLSDFLGQGDREPHVRSWGSPQGIGRNLDLREDTARFPPFGSDFEVFEDRFIEVMQFVVNHTTFDPEDELDAGLLAVLAPLGIAPGNTFDPDTAPDIDGGELRAVAQRVATEELARFSDQDWLDENLTGLFQPKGQITLAAQTFQSVAGPVGHLLRTGVARVDIDPPLESWEKIRRVTLTGNRTETYSLRVSDVTEIGAMTFSVTDYMANAPSREEMEAASRRFARQVDAQLATSRNKDIFIYTHGYNVDFDYSTLVSKELQHFLGYQGAFISYNWTATPSRFAYFRDQESAMATRRYLRSLIEFLSENTRARRIHLVGYSAGSRLAFEAAYQITLQPEPKPRMGRLILISSDLDRAFFLQAIADGLLDTVEDVTLYQSQTDAALAMSRFVFGRDRLGEASAEGEVEPAVQSKLAKLDSLHIIDVTEAEAAGAGNGHWYFQSSPWASSDLFLSLLTDRDPGERGLVRAPGEAVWHFPPHYPQVLRRVAVSD